MCSVLTTVKIPFHINVTVFRQKLRKKSIIIYKGKGCFKNKVFQVGNIGELSPDDIQFFLKSLEEALQSFDPVDIKNVASINVPRSILTPVNENVERKSFVSQDKA